MSVAGAVAEPPRRSPACRPFTSSARRSSRGGKSRIPWGTTRRGSRISKDGCWTAGQQREIVYRVYRHAEPITVGNLGAAELLHEIPAVLSAWNLLEIEVTEHPNQGTPTKNSVLRPGYNLALRHPMHRYRITAGGEPIPRGTALAVVTAGLPRRTTMP